MVSTNQASGLDAESQRQMAEATHLVAEKQIELSSKGYSQALIDATLSRARGTALAKIGPLDDDIKGRAFVSFLRDELSHAESWILAWTKGLNG